MFIIIKKKSEGSEVWKLKTNKNDFFIVYLVDIDKTTATKPADNISLCLYDYRKLALHWKLKTI